jgi:glutaredoxin-like protein NrdH
MQNSDNRLPVKVYGKDKCQQCKATLRRLEAREIRFECVNVDVDAAAATMVTKLGYQQVPVVVVPFDYEGMGGQHWSGFRPDLLDRLE